MARTLLANRATVKGFASKLHKSEEYRVLLFEEGSEERMVDRLSPLTPALSPKAGRGGPLAGAGTAQAGVLGASKGRAPIDARKVWEERKRGGRFTLQVMLRLK